MPTLEQLARFLGELLPTSATEAEGILVPRAAKVRRIGLLLEGSPELPEWVEANVLDALFLHRPWSTELDRLPRSLGVLASHQGFDRHLSVGHNLHLARALELRQVRSFALVDGLPLGMLGEVEGQSWSDFSARAQAEFGGAEALRAPSRASIQRVAVVGAMRDPLVREAVRRGADVYLTGQLRRPAERAVLETGIGVIATGHERAELWGLRQLGLLLRSAFTGLQVVVGEESG